MIKPVSPPYGWVRRVLWLVAIWLISVAALGAVAYALRLVMTAVGMST
ncbi:DUF2474 domain-containing protein [Aquabacterium sp.]|jgi:hypothetical protein|nr:DUF2474 domain-containing protein [Aquabacterium sp.]